MKQLLVNKVKVLLLAIYILLSTSCGISKSLRHQPEVQQYNASLPVVTKTDNGFVSGNNFLLKNRQQLWELYIEGDPLERGLLAGSLTDSLLKKQEKVFFAKVEELVPSRFKQKMLRNFLKWYNRKLYLHVPAEYKTEIYGLSQYSSSDLDHIAPKYLRSLYLHGAHDIGHALQDLALVGCTSFAAWDDKSADGALIIGRNFDFYAGDEFAKDKVVAFVKPDSGIPFMMVTWPGMIGAVSGMNKEGLTVTINASKSEMPYSAKTPISILTREILQYAKNLDDAVAIAKKAEVFVSESIMVGSAADGKAIIMEVSPDGFDVFNASEDLLLCSNHFQSNLLKGDKRNQDQMINSHSVYRFERLQELISKNPKIDPVKAAEILRNRDGINNIALGYGNEKALNQLLAHHAIIFQPEKRLVWVSANPYQMGEFVCYDLNQVFNDSLRIQKETITLQLTSENIPADPFLLTEAYQNYELFRIADRQIDQYLKDGFEVPDSELLNYQSLNPENWLVYYKAGKSFYSAKKYEQAMTQFNLALTKEITTLPEKEEILKFLKKIKRRL
jgi:predicted choloylglycine hydrolase